MSAQGALLDRSAYLIETLGASANGEIRHVDRHLGRMARSAQALAFPFDPRAAQKALEKAAAGIDGPSRLRLALSRDGLYDATAARFEPLQPDAVWRVGVAEARLDSSNPLLSHKVSQRPVYDAARLEMSERGLDEILLLNEREEVCEGSVTNLFAQIDGVLLTPPKDCGLLPGILRESLLEDGGVREARLRLEDLRRAEKLFVGNALRGLIQVELADGRNNVVIS